MRLMLPYGTQENKKLCLATLERKHAQELFQLVIDNKDYLSKWLRWPAMTKDVNDSLYFINQCQSQANEKSVLNMGIFWGDKLIGHIGQVNTNLESSHCEVGYWLSEKYSKKGMMSCVCHQFLSYLFKEREMNIIYIAAAVKNIASRKVAEKLGAKLDGVLRQREKLLSSEIIDHAYYSIKYDELIKG